MVVLNIIITVLVFQVLVAMLFKILSSQKNDGNSYHWSETNNFLKSAQIFLPYAKLDHFKIEESSARSLAEILNQRANKVVSDSPGLGDFAIGLVNSGFNLPDGQVMFLWGISITEEQKGFGASWNDVWASKC